MLGILLMIGEGAPAMCLAVSVSRVPLTRLLAFLACDGLGANIWSPSLDLVEEFTMVADKYQCHNVQAQHAATLSHAGVFGLAGNPQLFFNVFQMASDQ